MIKLFLKNLPVVLLALAVGLTFEFLAGEVEGKPLVIKTEDILLLVLGLVWIFNLLISGNKKLERPPLFFQILVWLSISLFSLLTNLIFGNIGLGRGFFFFLKEVEFFFLYFYLFYHIKSIDSAKFIIKIWIFLGSVNVGWVVYQLIFGITKYGYYGPGAIGEGKGSFPGGGFFALLFIFFFNLFLFYYSRIEITKFKKALLFCFIVIPALGVFSTGSRTVAMGFFPAFFLTIFLYFLKQKRKLNSLLTIILILAIASLSCSFLFLKVEGAERAINVWKIISGVLSGKDLLERFNIWKFNIAEFLKHPLFLLFGMGKSVQLFCGESHSHYVRNFVETGIVGFLAFFFLIFIILKKSLRAFLSEKDFFIVGLSSGLFVATLTMLVFSITAEAFITVKIAETYWFFIALTMATLYYFTKETKQKK